MRFRLFLIGLYEDEVMTIVHIIPSFGMGGAEKVVLNYLKAAKKNNLDFTAISLYGETGSKFDEIIKKENLNVIYLNKKLGVDVEIISRLRTEIIKLDPDVVHTHLYALKYYMLTFTWRGRKNYHTIHSLPSIDASGVDYLANRFMFSIGKTKPIVLHDDLIEETNKYYGISNARTLGNGVFFDEYTPDFDVNEKRKSLGISVDDYVIGHVGRFDEHKNHEFMIDLMTGIIKKKANAKLLLIGDGSNFVNIKELAKNKGIFENVIFTGNRSDVPELMKLMDIFLFPSIHEGFGIAVIEAQLAGINCVVSSCVPEKVCISDGVVFINLEESRQVWEKSLLKEHHVVHIDDRANNYNIEYIMKDLINIYGS